MSGKVLVVDDDQSMCETLVAALRRRDFTVEHSTSTAAAIALLDREDFDVVVTDLHMDGMDGIAFCEHVVQNRPGLPVVMITAFGTLETAVAAIRAGAYDFITKPFDIELVRLTLARAVHHRALDVEVKRLRREVRASLGEEMVGKSPALRRIIDLIERVAETDAPVLITGESGTGKELAARALHQRSRYAAGPFVAINCAAMPEPLLESELFGHVKGAFTDAHAPRQGLFLQARGGTLFLDEIGELPLGMQPKLLRALQEKRVRAVGSDREEPYDARILTASNRDLESEVEERRFREDLFYRINVVRVAVPPLRARGDDVLLLAQHFISERAKKSGKAVVGLSSAVAERLLAYCWPGNVRELSNCIERAVAFTRFEELAVDDLPEKVRDYRGVNLTVPGVGALELLSIEEVERRYILRVLRQLDGNKTATAEVLGLDRRTLYRKLERYGEADPEVVPTRALGRPDS
jgi:two-component system, NtrC family, response regulator AtoC